MARSDWGGFDWSSLGSGWGRDLRAAFAFFTSLSLGGANDEAGAGLGPALRAWPVVGIAVGIAGGIGFMAARGLGLSPLIAAIAALGIMVAATGAFHEDGLADFADGLGGGDKDARLAIMRDSRLGSYGMLALVFCLGLRAAALAEIAEPGAAAAALIAAAAASRGLVPLMTLHLGPARPDGLGAALGPADRNVVFTAAGIAVLASLILLGPVAGIVALACGLAAVAAVAALARARLGGYTGDVMGAAQQAAEAAILTVAAIFA